MNNIVCGEQYILTKKKIVKRWFLSTYPIAILLVIAILAVCIITAVWGFKTAAYGLTENNISLVMIFWKFIGGLLVGLVGVMGGILLLGFGNISDTVSEVADILRKDNEFLVYGIQYSGFCKHDHPIVGMDLDTIMAVFEANPKKLLFQVKPGVKTGYGCGSILYCEKGFKGCEQKFGVQYLSRIYSGQDIVYDFEIELLPEHSLKLKKFFDGKVNQVEEARQEKETEAKIEKALKGLASIQKDLKVYKEKQKSTVEEGLRTCAILEAEIIQAGMK